MSCRQTQLIQRPLSVEMVMLSTPCLIPCVSHPPTPTPSHPPTHTHTYTHTHPSTHDKKTFAFERKFAKTNVKLNFRLASWRLKSNLFTAPRTDYNIHSNYNKWLSLRVKTKAPCARLANDLFCVASVVYWRRCTLESQTVLRRAHVHVPGSLSCFVFIEFPPRLLGTSSVFQLTA